MAACLALFQTLDRGLLTPMLLNLVITNFAIIDRLEIEFGSGFNVLTGETGAGKSIIMDAFGLLLGDRARPDLVRAGVDEATVEALFDLSAAPKLQQLVADAGFSPGDELILRRIVSRAGRSRAFVNGSMATLGQLQPIAERLVTVCGQHEHQTLMQKDSHLDLLDGFGRLDQPLQTYRGAYQAYRLVSEQLASLTMAERERQQRLDLLRHQSREIGEAGLQPGEDEELAAERLLLQNAERLASVTQDGYDALYGADGAVCEVLGRLADELDSARSIDPQLGPPAEAVRQALYSLEDTAAQLRTSLGRMNFEPGRQEEVEARLALMAQLKRKYAPTIEELLALKEQHEAEIEQLENADAAHDALTRKQAELMESLHAAGQALSGARATAAQALSDAMVSELADLAMPGARFEARLLALAEPGAGGYERVEFFLAPNPGEGLMPLARIASGGELSRIMLALKRVAPGSMDVPTVIFDEVDAGIGGVTATAVGEKLHQVSRDSQVLCVTHLPQVAAVADRHYRVTKQETQGRTQTRLQLLDDDARVEEMARMLGGAHVTDRTRDHAREMILAAARSASVSP